MLKLGLPCVYRPRVPYGRQSELFCFVTRIINEDEGKVDLIAFPANSEPVHYNNVVRRSDTIQIHCWEPAQDDAEIKTLRETVDNLQKQMAALHKNTRKSQETAQASLHEAAAAASR